MSPNRFDTMTQEAPSEKRLPRLAKARGPEARAAEVVAREALNGRFHYAPALGWLAWDGVRWSSDETAEPRAREAVRVFADVTERTYRAEEVEHLMAADAVAAGVLVRTKSMKAEDAAKAVAKLDAKQRAAVVEDGGNDQEREAYNDAVRKALNAREQADIWLNLLSAAGIRNLLSLSSDRAEIVIRTTDLDRHPDLLNCTNGVVDLRTGELGKHDPKLLMTKVAAGPYVKGATHQAWKDALAAVAPGCEQWLQTRMGQSATGRRPDDDAMFICWGGGANGKTTVMSALETALGDYAGVVPHKVLLNTDPNAHSTELMNLRGLRLALMEETPEEGHLNMDRVKKTVGSKSITARLMRRDDVTFETTHTMWINTNHMPQVATTDDGTWRRLVAVPWPYRFRGPHDPLERENDRKGDRQLRPTLIDSPSADVVAAVLAWVVEGAVRWYEAGMESPAPPAAVVEASSHWRQDSDVALLFVRDKLIADPNGFILGSDMTNAFDEFMAEQRKRPLSVQTQRKRLEDAFRAEKIDTSATPEKTVKVRASDVQSVPPKFGAVTYPGVGQAAATGKVVRMWRGVRFRTSADPAYGEPGLRAV